MDWTAATGSRKANRVGWLVSASWPLLCFCDGERIGDNLLMNILGVLSLLGTILTAVGLGLTVLVTYREWSVLAGPTDYFVPLWLRRRLGMRVNAEVAGVDAAITLRASSGAIAGRAFDPSLPVEDRLAALETAVTGIDRNFQDSDQTIRAQLSTIQDDVDQLTAQVDQIPTQSAESERAKTVINLRNAGWSLLLAVVGLSLQIPEIVWDAF